MAGRLLKEAQQVAQVRGVLAERVVVSTPLDPFLSLQALAVYSGLSRRAAGLPHRPGPPPPLLSDRGQDCSAALRIRRLGRPLSAGGAR
jgi:hypothetical protein